MQSKCINIHCHGAQENGKIENASTLITLQPLPDVVRFHRRSLHGWLMWPRPNVRNTRMPGDLDVRTEDGCRVDQINFARRAPCSPGTFRAAE